MEVVDIKGVEGGTNDVLIARFTGSPKKSMDIFLFPGCPIDLPGLISNKALKNMKKQVFTADRVNPEVIKT